MCTLRTQIESDIGPIDILINNAALMPLLSFREGTEEEIERIIQVNITANIFVSPSKFVPVTAVTLTEIVMRYAKTSLRLQTTRIFLPGMLKRRQGHIVQLSSMSAMHPMPGAVIYTSTKYAVKGYVEALAHELRQEGYEDCVRFTSTHPYFVSTRKDMMDALSLRWICGAECDDSIFITDDFCFLSLGFRHWQRKRQPRLSWRLCYATNTLWVCRGLTAFWLLSWVRCRWKIKN